MGKEGVALAAPFFLGLFRVRAGAGGGGWPGAGAGLAARSGAWGCVGSGGGRRSAALGVAAHLGVRASHRERGTSLCRSTPSAAERRPRVRVGAWLRSLRDSGAIMLHGKRCEVETRRCGFSVFADRSHDPDVPEGRRTPGSWPKWHMDVPRPFVKTGRRLEGWAMTPGCGGPFRSRRFDPPAHKPMLRSTRSVADAFASRLRSRHSRQPAPKPVLRRADADADASPADRRRRLG